MECRRMKTNQRVNNRNRFMKMKVNRGSYHRFIWITLLASIAIILSIALPLKNTYFSPSVEGSNLRVEVVVPFRHELKLVHQLQSIKVSDSDIAKGYVDVVGATQLSIYDNDRDGFVLLIEGLTWPFRQAIIDGLSQQIQLSMPSCFIHQPYSKTPITATLSYHFEFAENVKPGEYVWPLAISLHPDH